MYMLVGNDGLCVHVGRHVFVTHLTALFYCGAFAIKVPVK